MADHTPPTNSLEDAPAKRDIPYECKFAETFDVLVGRDPNQQLFTVHHDVITRRSKFFRQARNPRWKKSTPIELQHADPQIFDMYLQCVYHGTVPDFTGNEEEDERGEQCYEAFVDLYILADSLLDPVTTTLVSEEIHEIGSAENIPGAGVIKHAYRHTTAGCALRNALVEIYAIATSLPDGDFPKAFLRSLVEKQMYWRHGE
jgi:hypothetical protein